MQQKTSAFLENFSTGLKYARLARGLTQADLAEQLGEKQSAVSNWERMDNGPGRKLARIAEFFAVFIDPITGEWKSIPETSRMIVRDPGGAAHRPPSPADLAWMLEDFPEASLIDKIGRSLRDQEVGLRERVRRARMFLAELERRANSDVDAAARTLLEKAVADVKKPRVPVKYGPSPKAEPER